MLAVLVKLVSRAACLILIASFVMFVDDEAGRESEQRAAMISQGPTAQIVRDAHGRDMAQKRTMLRQRVDELSDKLTSPVDDALKNASPWEKRSAAFIGGFFFWGIFLHFLARYVSLSRLGLKRGKVAPAQSFSSY